MEKASVRMEMATRRDEVPASQVKKLSNKICSSIMKSNEIQVANSVGIYFSFRNEVAAENLFAPLSAAGKKVFAPVILGDGIKFAQINSIKDVRLGFKGIREPNSELFAKNESIDLFIAPGLAFDRRCFRIGWGQGHYDKFLAMNNNAVLIGAAYDFQIVDEISSKPHDIKMDFVITEKRVLES